MPVGAVTECFLILKPRVGIVLNGDSPIDLLARLVNLRVRVEAIVCADLKIYSSV